MGRPKPGSSVARQLQVARVVNAVTNIWVAYNLGNVIIRCAICQLVKIHCSEQSTLFSF